MLRFDDAERTLLLGVHDLIDAGPPRGHLHMQAAWSARARMAAGQEVHLQYQAARSQADASFAAEVRLKHTMVVRGWTVTISGRVDGLSEEGGRSVVEEVKSTTLPSDRLAGRTVDDFPSYRRQLELYLWFLRKRRVHSVGRLVLISLVDGGKHVLQIEDNLDIDGWIEAQLDWLITEREERMAWLAVRGQAAVPFPHPRFREGQASLADDVAASLHAGRHLLLAAPTGYGKTAAALWAALRVAYQTDKRVFFATARTTQQRMAEDTVQAMAGAGLPVRAVSIRARDKVCLNEVVACRPDCCAYAESYFDKVRTGGLVRRLFDPEGAARGAPSVDAVVAISQEAMACPFALTLDMVRQADVVIGDYNYVFDPAVRLSSLSDAPGEWIVIVDEAHNLPDRARGYASPELTLQTVETAAAALGGGPFSTRYRLFAELAEDVLEWLREGTAQVPPGARDGEAAFPVGEGLDRRELGSLVQRADALAMDYGLAKQERPLFGAGEGDPWLDTTRALGRLRSVLERAGDETVVIWKQSRWRGGRRRSSGQLSLVPRAATGDPHAGLKVLCRDPSGILGPLFADVAGSVIMSATLRPQDFYVDQLGLVADRVEPVERPSPFPPDNQLSLLVPAVSTEYRHRDRDRAQTAALISEAVQAVPGNVAVFFPSFAFLEAVKPLLALGERPVLVQQRGMSEAARADLLAVLKAEEGHALLGVLGGIFAEGVDLPGRALMAAIVVGPALPQANLERRLLQRWHQEQHEQGFRYAWLVPGMRRVVQAAGRVVRTPEDVGAIVLLGKRFLRREYQSLFPDDWSLERSGAPGADLRDFFDRVGLS